MRRLVLATAALAALTLASAPAAAQVTLATIGEVCPTVTVAQAYSILETYEFSDNAPQAKEQLAAVCADENLVQKAVLHAPPRPPQMRLPPPPRRLPPMVQRRPPAPHLRPPSPARYGQMAPRRANAAPRAQHRKPVTARELEILARRAQEVLGPTPDNKTPLYRFTEGKQPIKPGCVFVRAVADPKVRGLKHAVWDCRQVNGKTTNGNGDDD